MKNFTSLFSFGVVATSSMLVFILLAGFYISKLKNLRLAGILSWLIVLVTIVCEERLTIAESPFLRMLGIILVTLFAMKIPVVVASYPTKSSPLSFVQWLCFAAGWFGMRPGIFERFPGPPLPGWKSLFAVGLSRIGLGVVLVGLASLVAGHFTGMIPKAICTGLLLAGLSLLLHFGILNISTAMWRFSGVDARMLFRSPLLSTSLNEFWGKRWNLAFSEMTAVAIYRPLKNKLGKKTALFVAFLFSGLLHEMALSVPVKAGYGLPMLYFCIHGLVMLLEDKLKENGIRLGENKLLGRIWVIFWLILPLPLLFHKAFLKEILWPLIGLV